MGWAGWAGEEDVQDEWRGGGGIDGVEFVCLYCVVGVDVEVDGLREGKVFEFGRVKERCSNSDEWKEMISREAGLGGVWESSCFQRRRGRLEHWRMGIGVMAL